MIAASKLADVYVNLKLHGAGIFSPYVFSLVHTLEVLNKCQIDVNYNKTWKEVLDCPNNQVKIFGIFIQKIYEALRNICALQLSSLEDCLCHTYHQIVSMEYSLQELYFSYYC